MKNKLIFAILLLFSISVILAYPIGLVPRDVNGNLQPNTNFAYIINFTSYSNCSGVLQSFSYGAYTNRQGVDFVDLNITDTDPKPSYICVYINGVLKHSYNITDMFFDEIYGRGANFSESVNATSFYQGNYAVCDESNNCNFLEKNSNISASGYNLTIDYINGLNLTKINENATIFSKNGNDVYLTNLSSYLGIGLKNPSTDNNALEINASLGNIYYANDDGNYFNISRIEALGTSYILLEGKSLVGVSETPAFAMADYSLLISKTMNPTFAFTSNESEGFANSSAIRYNETEDKLYFEGSATYDFDIGIVSRTTIVPSYMFDWEDYDTGIFSSGNNTIGFASNGNYPLYINGTNNSVGVNFKNIELIKLHQFMVNGTSNVSNGDFIVNENDLFVQQSTGRVGINTTTPTSLLTIEGRGTNDGICLGIDKDNCIYENANNDIRFSVGGLDKLALLGAYGQISTDFYPAVNKTFDLGGINRYWQELYVKQIIADVVLDIIGKINITDDINQTGGHSFINNINAEAYYHNHTGTRINFAVDGTYYNLFLTNVSNADGFTYKGGYNQTSNFTALYDGMFIAYHYSEGTGQNNHNYHSSVFIDGINQENCETHGKWSVGDDVQPMGKPCTINVTAGDVIDIRVADIGGTGFGNYSAGSLNLRWLSNL